eukprot:COSAG04_NODE_1418_length_6841_cov_6.335509_5_plen_239_part_00
MLIRRHALSGRVKRLSALKMSSYHIHLSDDSGYALPSKAFPNLTSPHLALSLEDWQTLVATAAAYHVELVPEIDLPGHSSWIAKQLPELLGPTCSPGVSWCPIDTSPPALNRTVEIVSQIFEEVFALFKHSRYHHLGADEVYEDPRQVQPLLCVLLHEPSKQVAAQLDDPLQVQPQWHIPAQRLYSAALPGVAARRPGVVAALRGLYPPGQGRLTRVHQPNAPVRQEQRAAHDCVGGL